MFRLAILSNDGSFHAFMVSKLREKFLNGELALTEILAFADRHQIRELQGAAYYSQVVVCQKNDADEPIFPVGSPLTKYQRARLLASHSSLVRKWERLRDLHSWMLPLAQYMGHPVPIG